jgi:MFS family permease
MFYRILNIHPKEQKTFVLHMIYSIVDGLVLGIFAFNEFILIKSLKGTNYQIGFIVQSTVIVLSFSIIFNIIFKSIRKKVSFIRIIGIITRLPLFIFLLFPKTSLNVDNAIYYQLAFILIFLIYYMSNPLLLPVINQMLKDAYSQENFGKLYGYASAISKIMMLFTTFLFGILLDFDHSAYRYIYPVISILGISSIFILTNIKIEEIEKPETHNNLLFSIKNTIRESLQILRTNKPYRHFENAFFLYGLAWMATAAVIPIFFEKELNLNYSSIAFYKNSYNTLSILILPFFGKIIGKIDPRRFAIITFSAMLLHILFMLLTEYFPFSFEFLGIKLYYSLICSYVMYAIFGALMALLWYIGSAYFCKNEEVGNYQAIHVSLTGIRGFMAPLLGIFLLDLIGYSGVFFASIFSLGCAIYIMFFSMRKIPLKSIDK